MMVKTDDYGWIGEPTWVDRLYYWFATKFRKFDCDGCRGTFPWEAVTPVSGDAWLCDKCFRHWYPEYCETEGDRNDSAIGP